MPVTKTPILKILSDLGIDLMDVDNDEDYLRALMEGVNQLTLIDPKHRDIPTLQKEIERIRQSRKAAAPSPGMQATKKKISGASIKRGGALAIADKRIGLPPLVTQPVVQQTTVVAGKGGESSSSPKFQLSLIEILKGILNNVNGMLAVLASRQVFETKKENRDRKRDEKARRNIREAKIEENKRFEGIKQAGIKAMQPAINLWGRLWDFLTTIFLGRAALKLWDWFTDPENQAKFSRLAERFKKWWPQFVEGTKEFFNQVIDFSKWVVENIGAWTTTLLTTTIPALTAALVGMGPWGVAGAATAGLAGGLIWNQTQKSGDEEESSTTTPASPTITEQTGATIIQEQTGETIIQDSFPQSDKIDPFEVLEKNRDLVPLGMYNVALNEIRKDPSAYDTREEIEDALSGFGIDPGRIKYAEGGHVPGRGDKDTVPAMLTPGEFVMSKGAVEKYGADVLAAMNAMGGGTNIPLIGGLSGLGGGGGGTDALTEQAKIKTFASAILDFFSGDDGKSRRMTKHDRWMEMSGGGSVDYDMFSGARAILDLDPRITNKGAAYLAGNIQQESTWDGMRSWGQVLGDGTSRNGGLVSWASWRTDPARLGAIEKDYGKKIDEIPEYEQLKWMIKEMKQSYPAAYRTFTNPKATEDDLKKASYWYWGYGHEGARFKYAQQVMDNLNLKPHERGKSSTTDDKKKTKEDRLKNPAFKKVFEAFGGTEIFKNLQKGMDAIQNLRKELFEGMDYDDLISKGLGEKRTIPRPPPVPKPTVTFDGQTGNEAFQQSAAPNSNMSLPSLDASSMISGKKISTLGISV